MFAVACGQSSQVDQAGPIQFKSLNSRPTNRGEANKMCERQIPGKMNFTDIGSRVKKRSKFSGIWVNSLRFCVLVIVAGTASARQVFKNRLATFDGRINMVKFKVLRRILADPKAIFAPEFGPFPNRLSEFFSGKGRFSRHDFGMKNSGFASIGRAKCRVIEPVQSIFRAFPRRAILFGRSIWKALPARKV